MIWLTWRQFRVQFVTAAALLVASGAYLVAIGVAIRRAYTSEVLGCVAAEGCQLADAKDRFLQDHHMFVDAPGVVLVALPAIIGIFWGAPLITRELETNTHRLVWNQSVTRSRWLAVKLVFVGVVAVVVTGLLSLLLTWAASRIDQLQGNRFGPLSFESRNVAPVGYVMFAFVLGTTVGLFLRRTVATMAVTLLVIGVCQVLIPSIARPYVWAPVTSSVQYDATTRERAGFLGIGRTEPTIVHGYTVPGALMLTSEAYLVTASGGKVYAKDLRDCLAPAAGSQPGDVATTALDPMEVCIAGHNLHFEVTYQPGSRYWPFQWLESGVFLLLSALLTAVAFWRIRHVRG